MASSSIDPGKRDENSEGDPAENEETPAGEQPGFGAPPAPPGRNDVPDTSADPSGADAPADDPADAAELTTPEEEELDELSEPVEDEFTDPDLAPGDSPSTGYDRPGGADDGGYDEESSPSFTGRALMLLIFALVIFGLSLWIVPNVAPHLPSGIAQHLTPGQVELDNRLADIDQRIGTGIEDVARELAALREENAALTERVNQAEATASAARDAAAESAQSAESNAAAAEGVARAEQTASEASELATAASSEITGLTDRISGIEEQLTQLSDRFQALDEGFAAGAENGEMAAPHLAAGFSALRAEVEELRERIGESGAAEPGQFVTKEELASTRDAVRDEIQEAIAGLPAADAIAAKADLLALREEAEGAVQLLAERIDEVRKTALDAASSAETAEQAASSAVGRVDDAIRDARMRAVAASLNSRLATGTGFAEALEEAATLTGAEPPEELARVAKAGVPTVAELRASFGRPARNAVEAVIEGESGGGLLGQARARVGSVLAGRPAGEQDGQTVDAILSRIDARLRENDAEGALAEAETLPEPAQRGLGSWLERLREHVAASAAAKEWLAPASGSDKVEG